VLPQHQLVPLQTAKFISKLDDEDNHCGSCAVVVVGGGGDDDDQI